MGEPTPDEDSSGAAATKKTTGRRPGRPPKKKLNDVQIQTYGIVDEPQSSGNIMELVSAKPIMFKKIFTLYGKYEVSHLTWNFYADRITINVKDFNGKTLLLTTIFGRMLVRYYCKEPMSRTITQKNIMKVFKSMDRNYPKVTMVFREEDSRSKMYVTAENSEVSAVYTYDLDLIRDPAIQNIPEKTEAEYPLKFHLPSKHIKKVIVDITNASSASIENRVFTVQKQGTNPLIFTFMQVNKIGVAGRYTNPDLIGLKYDLPEEDILSVSVPIKDVKPFTDSSIGDVVHFAVDKFEDFSMFSDLEHKKYNRPDGSTIEGPICRVQVFVQIQKFAK